jgi:hypothetical protein
MSFKQGLKVRRELRMILNRRRIDEKPRLLGQVVERIWRIVFVLFLPQSPRPDPLSGRSGGWRAELPYALIGTSAATGRP